MYNVLVGFYNVPNFGPDKVEVPLTGNGKHDYACLAEEMRKKHPKVDPKTITRTGSNIEARETKLDKVEYRAGAILKNLFQTEGTEEEASIRIGECEFSGESCFIVLRYGRAKNVMGINLSERRNGSTIRFSDEIPGLRLVTDLPELVKQILGPGAQKVSFILAEIK